MTGSYRTRQKLKVGAVSYLNTKPLIFGFTQHVPDSELLLDVPSRLADRLAAGDLKHGQQAHPDRRRGAQAASLA